MTIDFFNRVGYQPPWIGYYASLGNTLVGSAAFKGPPVDGTVEIAYGTFADHQRQGVATAMCQALIEIAQQANPAVRITARTLQDNSPSHRVLEKNNFHRLGIIQDPEDGEVLEWEWGKSTKA